MRKRFPIITRSRCIVVGNKGILVQKDDEGIYGLPGGRLEFNETLPLCVVRELKEEAGIDVIPQRIVYIVEYRGVKKGKYKHEILYFFRCDYKGYLKPKSRTLSFGWRDPSDLPKEHFWPEPLADVLAKDYPDFNKVRFIVYIDGKLSYLNTFKVKFE